MTSRAYPPARALSIAMLPSAVRSATWRPSPLINMAGIGLARIIVMPADTGLRPAQRHPLRHSRHQSLPIRIKPNTVPDWAGASTPAQGLDAQPLATSNSRTRDRTSDVDGKRGSGSVDLGVHIT